MNKLIQLATEINEFLYSYDTYGYMDAIENKDTSEIILDIAENIQTKNKSLLAELQGIINENENKDDVNKCQEFIKRIFEI